MMQANSIGLIVIVSKHTQSLFCNWDVGLHSQALQESQPDYDPSLHHPSSPVFPSHDGQIPKFKNIEKKMSNLHTQVMIEYSGYEIFMPHPYLGEPLKAANRLIVSGCIFKTLPQPFLISHSDIVTCVHVTTICERKYWV